MSASWSLTWLCLSSCTLRHLLATLVFQQLMMVARSCSAETSSMSSVGSTETLTVRVCLCVCVCVRACVRACVVFSRGVYRWSPALLLTTHFEPLLSTVADISSNISLEIFECDISGSVYSQEMDIHNHNLTKFFYI